MRFVFAIAAFVAAAALIGLGFAQRTIWAPPPTVSASASVDSGAKYVIVGGKTLNSIEGQQTLSVSGGAGTPFVAYGRTADVIGWLGDSPYERLTYDKTDGDLKAHLVNGPVDQDAATPDPRGSDLWLEEFSGQAAEKTRMNVPDSVSVIIATDGKNPAPSHVSLTWPTDTATPWAGPLIVLGGVLLVVGIVLYVLAIRHVRRSHGPRRGQRRGRRLRAPKPTPALDEAGGIRGRRAIGRAFVAVPIVLAGALTLAGCSSDYWPSFGEASPSATATATPIATDVPGEDSDDPAPAVTVAQLKNIVARISKTAAEADKTRDAKLAATRFTGAALAERTANYKIRAKKTDYAKPQAIADGELYPVLPQATSSWPRSVAVLDTDKTKKNAAPLYLVLTQESPRENYKIAYSVVVLGGARVPELPPASIGTPLVSTDSKLVTVPPGRLAQDYADVLARGKQSKSYSEFDESDDALTKMSGADYKAQQIRALLKAKSAGSLAFADRPGDSDPVALATNKAGALVATSVQESSSIRPTDPQATVSVKSDTATAALIGKTQSSTGLETTYGYQLLFYVPPAESGDKVQLLGFTQAVIGARELPK
ncbi:hypothetical protein [Gryllotalpicola ginsengisoli]|uniref:hypothetical protein n=1 Tax=Gryllotalpicola ginsengisoli TaxID=444608 RepID=UPI0003B55A0D|nr:hypothetical protein [Gryllotalpicola ginsengisoli]